MGGPTVRRIDFCPFGSVPAVPARVGSVELASVSIDVNLAHKSANSSVKSLSFGKGIRTFNIIIPNALGFVCTNSGGKNVVLAVSFRRHAALTGLTPFTLDKSPCSTVCLRSPGMIVSALNAMNDNKKTAMSNSLPGKLRVSKGIPLSNNLTSINGLLKRRDGLFSLANAVS